MSNVSILGALGAMSAPPGNRRTVGIYVEPAGVSTSFVLSDLNIVFVDIALQTVVTLEKEIDGAREYAAEGIYLNRYEFVGVREAIRIAGGYVLKFLDGHIDYATSGVKVDGSSSITLSNNTIMHGPWGWRTPGNAFEADGSRMQTIQGNHFLGPSTFPDDVPNDANGVILGHRDGASENTLILGNYFAGFPSTAVWLREHTVGNRVANNLFENNGRNVLDEGDNDTSDSRRGRSQAAGQVVAAAVTAAVIVSVIIGFLMP